MHMSYTNNPNLPYVRYEAVKLIQQGWSLRKVARHTGFAHNTILNWTRRKPVYQQGRGSTLVIPTFSSKPKHHPKEVSKEIIEKILNLRMERNQCAEILHYRLAQEGCAISLSSVKRILKRHRVSKFSKWKKWHRYPARPLPEKPGILVQIDAVHEGPPQDRLSAYALVDVCSRWAYAKVSIRINSWATAEFLQDARRQSLFEFQTIQTDHGSEFSLWLTKRLHEQGISHRHSRIRTPTDNGHVERFIRTLQDECLHKIPKDLKIWQKEIPEFLHYYNTERPHMGLDMKTPMQVVRSY